MQTTLDVSIIVPAYNEGKVIHHTIYQLLELLGSLRYSYEVIVVSDGCIDDTVAVVKAIKNSHLEVLSYDQNQGKGHAIKYGASRARGEIIMFYDAGGEFASDHVKRFIELMYSSDADIVIGSKGHPDSVVRYPATRHVISWGYHILVSLLFRLHIKDTQTGIKALKHKVAKNNIATT